MKRSVEIKIPRLLSKIVLWTTSFANDNYLVLVCKGYGDDYENYTGLYWDEDRAIDLIRDAVYEDFRLWISW